MRNIIPISHPRSGRTGFSLIELLVSILVVAILAAILLSVTSSMRTRSTRIESVSRMRSLHTAFLAFANDHDGALPTNGQHEDSDVPDDKAKRYNLQLAQYVSDNFPNSQSIHVSKYFRPPWEEFEPTGERRMGAVGTYGYNTYFAGRHGVVRLDAIVDPSKVPLLGDMTGPSGGLRMDPAGPHPTTTKYGYRGVTHGFGPAVGPDGHSGFLFADGHVEVRTIHDETQWPWNDRSIFNPFGK